MEYEPGKSMGEIQIGDKASHSKTITETDIYTYAGLGGDFNPLHVNKEYAKNTRFKGIIAHGGVATALLGPVLGMKLPGLGTLFIEATTRFKAPVFPGDTITVTAEATAKDEERNILTLKLTWENQREEVVIEGECKVMPPRKKK